jgi:hypothetical protein
MGSLPECDQVSRPLLGRGAGGRSPGILSIHRAWNAIKAARIVMTTSNTSEAAAKSGNLIMTLLVGRVATNDSPVYPPLRQLNNSHSSLGSHVDLLVLRIARHFLSDPWGNVQVLVWRLHFDFSQNNAFEETFVDVYLPIN